MEIDRSVFRRCEAVIHFEGYDVEGRAEVLIAPRYKTLFLEELRHRSLSYCESINASSVASKMPRLTCRVVFNGDFDDFRECIGACIEKWEADGCGGAGISGGTT
jgi:hypothetical protein